MRRLIAASFSLAVSVSVAAVLMSKSAGASSGCPSPAQAKGGQCVLLADAVLDETMLLASETQLNCQGHRLLPSTAGQLDDPRTTANEFQPSRPDLAVFVHRAYGVKIQNCVISGFDFGIIVAQSKAEDRGAGGGPSNKILSNVIEVRTNPIDVINSDNVLIAGNSLAYWSERGRGIVVDFDSDWNEIRNNTIVSTDAASTGQVQQVPGGPFVAATAIMDNEIHCLQSLNDFTDYAVAIRTTNDFTTTTDISADSGNYWDLKCPGFDQDLVVFENGTNNTAVFDGKPYGKPVADAGKLPKRCDE